MKNALSYIAIAAILFSLSLLYSCNEEDDSYWCGCNEDPDGDAESAESLEDSEIDSDGDTDGDIDSIEDETAEDGESALETDTEEPAFVPADCILDSACTRLLVAAHRGYHEVHPDNTLAAVRAAFELGADLAEVDVLETADDVLVLSHENDLSLITDGSGNIDQMNWDDIKDFNVNDGDPGNPESIHLGRFIDALAIAREYGKMLYVDVKTSRGDLIVAAIESQNYYKEALVREEIDNLLPMLAIDGELIVMPPVENNVQFDNVVTLAAPPIVEIALVAANAELGAYINADGVKIQQDVMVVGDTKAVFSNDYSGWKGFIDTGVVLLQTDAPKLLVPAVAEYNRSGVFPESGPEEE